MATSRRLDSGWTLTDGIQRPFLLPHPMPVADALREQGLLHKRPAGSQFLHEEWVYQHTFTYACRFALPEEDDEIAALHFEALRGQGFVLLNRKIIWAFDDESTHIPINAHAMRQGENLLEVQFTPPNERQSFGIAGDVRLRTTNYLMLHTARFWGEEERILAQTELECFSAGKYLFKYTVSLEDAALGNFEFIERIGALTQATLSHELPIANPIPWDKSSPGDSRYTVRLSIERMGIGCELVRADVALLPRGYAPKKLVRLPQGCHDERLLRLICELGADAVAVPVSPGRLNDQAPLLLPNYLHFGLLCVNADEYEPLPMERALIPMESLTALSGDMEYWPSDAPLFRLLGAKALDAALYEERFGVNATGDARRCVGYSRQLQADRLLTLAGERLAADQPTMIPLLIDPVPTPLSAALLDPDGARRPAYDALKSIWNP